MQKKCVEDFEESNKSPPIWVKLNGNNRLLGV